ncbi:MAG: ATP-binding cassette domain-containing protein [Christensenellales bacterium]
MSKIIELKNVKKYFKDVKAVDDLSFSVNKGELFAFLGVNGAGKSTTISMICGTLNKDSGQIFVDGRDIEKDKQSVLADIGVVFQNSVLDQQLTVLDNLYIKSAFYGLNKTQTKQRICELAKLLDFENILNRTVANLSGGQRRRIDIARALLNNPKILILDEPTTGLDPQTRKLLWQVIENCRKEKGLTVFLTTHYMEEASDADYVVIIDSGKIVAKGTPVELKNLYTGDFITIYNVDEEKIKSLGVKYEKNKDSFRVEVKNIEEAKKLIIAHPEIFDDFELVKGKMDDVFLSVTGKKLLGEN